MKNLDLASICPFEIGNKVKLMLDENVYSESEYTVDDIIMTQSIKTGEVKFKIIVIDDNNRPLSQREASSLKLVKK